MRKLFVILFFIGGIIGSVSFTDKEKELSDSKLRKLYSQSPEKWPYPSIDAGVSWKELGLLPPSPLESLKDEWKDKIELGKILFFDPRLSGSGKISCASCHQPELNWTDGKEKSIGHEGAVNKRNSPTIQNSWFYNRYFWDGRAKDLQDQAFAPLNSETEMHNEMHTIMINLSKINGYKALFRKAYGDDQLSPDRLTEAIAIFEKTIISRKSRFDEFLEGNKKALTNNEIRGLHLFRTKARCMNCHNGPLFSDNQFHNNGFSGSDKGYYTVSHKEEDTGKMKTPSLRDVTKTGPWMHNGAFRDIKNIIDTYDRAAFSPGTDKLVRHLALSVKEKQQLLDFLGAISSAPVDFKKPVIPE